jgi:hypothetical protein
MGASVGLLVAGTALLLFASPAMADPTPEPSSTETATASDSPAPAVTVTATPTPAPTVTQVVIESPTPAPTVTQTVVTQGDSGWTADQSQAVVVTLEALGGLLAVAGGLGTARLLRG